MLQGQKCIFIKQNQKLNMKIQKKKKYTPVNL